MTNPKLHYAGKIIRVTQERVELPNGRFCELDIVHHPGGVGVVAIDAQQRLCVLRQYRHVARGWLWEIPAGKIDAQENPADTAKRELREEAGVEAGQWQRLGETFTSPGVFTEIIHVYLARDLRSVATEHQSDELIEVHWMALQDIKQRIAAGEIIDAKTIVAISLLELKLLC